MLSTISKQLGENFFGCLMDNILMDNGFLGRLLLFARSQKKNKKLLLLGNISPISFGLHKKIATFAA